MTDRTMADSARRSPLASQIGRIDRVVLAIIAILAMIALINLQQFSASLAFVANAFLYTGPFLALSVLIAAYAAGSGAENLISRIFQTSPIKTIILAAIFGGLSPFCSCGVIPLIAAMLAMGVPLAPVMAFWLASPVMDPSMFVLTTGLLDAEFAIAKTMTAVGLGLFGGFVTHAMTTNGMFADPLRPGVGDGGCGGAKVRDDKPVIWQFWNEPERRAKFAANARKNTVFLGKWLMLAFLLESLMVAYLPGDLVVQAVGGEGLQPLVLATLVGIPAYLNGYAALPLVSGLIEQGMTPGAGLAFLVAGGVTSVPAAIAVFALVKKPIFFLYVGFAIVGSITAGSAFELWMAMTA
ncbi:MAG: permease [Pseudomonadota bacterium]